MTLADRVERERRRARAVTLAAGGLLALGVLAGALAIGIAALGGDRWLRLPAALPWIVWLVALGLAGAVLVLARRRAARESGVSEIAAAIERDQRLRGGSLRVALEVRDTGALGRRAADDVDRRLAAQTRALAPSLRGRLVRRARMAGGVAAVAALALVSAGAAVGDGWAPLAHPLDAANGTLLPAIRIAAPAHVVRGEPVPVRIEAPRRRAVVVSLRSRGAAWRTETVRLDDGAGTLRLSADADIVLVASDGRATSDTATIRVVDRPFVGDVTLRAVYPAYLNRAPEPLVLGALVRVPRGTVIDVRGRASTALRQVSLDAAGASVALRADGHDFGGRFAPGASGRWAWRAEGAAGPIGDVPPPLDVEVVPDSAPQVELLAPARDTIVSTSDQVRIAVGASDDYGLAAVELRTTRRTASGASLPSTVTRLAVGAPTPWLGEAVLDLAARGLEPGDELQIVATATDASPWSQRGESRAVVLRVPGLSEQRTIARRTADSAVAMAMATATAQRDLQRRTGDAARARDRSRPSQQSAASRAEARAGDTPPSMSYESAEQARAIAQEQRALAERVEKLREAARALERQLREAGALDAELAARMQEVQQLLRDALTPEMAAKIAELEGAAQRLQGEQARQSLAELAAQQRRLREQLERSVEMLKRAALEGAMETLRDEAKELADAQRRLADSLAGRPRESANRQARPADAPQLAERSRDLARDLDKLAERLQAEDARTGAERTQAASRHAERSAARMQRAAGARRQQGDAGTDRRQSGASQERGADEAAAAAEEMQRAAEEMARARDQQIDEWKTELAQELDRSILEALQLARQEEQLAEQAQGNGSEAGLRAQQSAIQQGTQKLGERLGQAGQKSTHVSQRSQRALTDAARKVAEATRETGERRGSSSAANAMREAASALNQAAASLVRDRERLGSASSASGFAEMLEQMRELAKQQGSIAAQAQGLSLIPGQQGRQQSPSEMASGARGLARAQRQVAEALEELGGVDGSGRAEQLAEEARRIAQALERGVVDAGIVDRQQRLFRRLLDAGRTLEQDEREDTGRREARSAVGAPVLTPEGARASGRDALRYRPPDWSELRGLSAEERRLVLEYFKRLNAEQP